MVRRNALSPLDLWLDGVLLIPGFDAPFCQTGWIMFNLVLTASSLAESDSHPIPDAGRGLSLHDGYMPLIETGPCF